MEQVASREKLKPNCGVAFLNPSIQETQPCRSPSSKSVCRASEFQDSKARQCKGIGKQKAGDAAIEQGGMFQISKQQNFDSFGHVSLALYSRGVACWNN